MTHRLTTNYAKNNCNRTLIVKGIIEKVVTCFFWDTVYNTSQWKNKQINVTNTQKSKHSD